MSHSLPSDGHTEIQELNRVFLNFLRGRLTARADMLGLPGQVAAVLADMADERISGLAAYPQAMFRFNLEALDAATETEPTEPVDPALAGLHILLLVSARHLCLEKPYAARLFLRLTPAEVEALGALPMTELQRVAARRRLVRCAYVRLSWMWTELIRAVEPDRARALILLGLQPSVELNPPLPARA
jgi:hypothetical protein